MMLAQLLARRVGNPIGI